jgi:hypothetical protein
MIRDFFVFLRRCLIVLVILALLSPLFAHQIAVEVIHKLIILAFGGGKAKLPSIKISP